MEATPQNLDLNSLTEDLINRTSRHVFLTGKAGTGKTTFLKNLAATTHKEFVVVAPTGIAALNAEGVTIHSQFLFPFGSFIPERKPAGLFGQQARFYTQQTLASKHPLNSIRKQVLRNIDLLIIDEVSMLRADLLDAIDYRMRSVKGNFQQSFGGVQVLFIGDLFQLPPIVKDAEWAELKNYYRSMHFYEALALKQDGMVVVELEKIYRQSDSEFIQILNRLRNNKALPEDFEVLNQHYNPEADKESGVITLTTHNHKADAINQNQLEQLENKKHLFTAKIEKDFPEHMFPVEQRLELKEGAQIMFIKNDTSGNNLFYNGKIAKISSILGQDIWVEPLDGGDSFQLEKEEWPNKKYVVNAETNEIDEEEVGKFIQYPIKLAWAVTIHKSQGLTFDKAIIDVGQAFAPGQVYVALSRLRSLEGLSMRTKIAGHTLSSDFNVVNFMQQQSDKTKLPNILENGQLTYLQEFLRQAFNLQGLDHALGAIQNNKKINLDFELDHMNKVVTELRYSLQPDLAVAAKFQRQLERLVAEKDLSQLQERLNKGQSYFLQKLQTWHRKLHIHIAEVNQFTKTKTYLEALDELDQIIMKRYHSMDKASALAMSVIQRKPANLGNALDSKWVRFKEEIKSEAEEAAKNNPQLGKTKSGRKKREKGETYQTTYALVNDGMSIAEIADSRGLAFSTVESHIVKGIQTKEIEISQVLDQETIDVLKLSLQKTRQGIKEIHKAFKGKYSFGEIRMVQASLLVHSN